jgi:hypothetical protein
VLYVPCSPVHIISKEFRNGRTIQSRFLFEFASLLLQNWCTTGLLLLSTVGWHGLSHTAFGQLVLVKLYHATTSGKIPYTSSNPSIKHNLHIQKAVIRVPYNTSTCQSIVRGCWEYVCSYQQNWDSQPDFLNCHKFLPAHCQQLQLSVGHPLIG